MNGADQLLTDVAADGPARQEVLGPIDLGRLRQDGGAAIIHEDVGRGPERRIGRDARIAVRPAALQRQHQFGGWDRLAPRRIGGRHHAAQPGHAALDRLLRAAGVLDRHGLEMLALAQAVFGLHATDLENFAAETDEEHAGDVGVRRVTPLGPLQGFETRALVGHATAGAMHQRDDAVDIRVIAENAGALDLFGHEAGHRSGTVHRGQDREIVAGAGLAAGATEALKGRLL